MREVKFRAWIKSLKVMADVLSIDFKDKEVLLKGHKRDTIASFSQVDLLQYTGLKDKNGVEIYEGDIINVHWFYASHDPVTLGVYGDEISLECVEVIEVRGKLGFYFKDDFLPLDSVPAHEESFEVVGNVYESMNY